MQQTGSNSVPNASGAAPMSNHHQTHHSCTAQIQFLAASLHSPFQGIQRTQIRIVKPCRAAMLLSVILETQTKISTISIQLQAASFRTPLQKCGHHLRNSMLSNIYLYICQISCSPLVPVQPICHAFKPITQKSASSERDISPKGRPQMCVCYLGSISKERSARL